MAIGSILVPMACAYFTPVSTCEIGRSVSKRERRMFVFLVLISPGCAALAFSYGYTCAWACAYLTSVQAGQALWVARCLLNGPGCCMHWTKDKKLGV